MTDLPDLVLTIDKFAFRVPQDRRYSRADCWLRIEGEKARIGLTDFRQQTAGDVAFVETAQVGMVVVQDEEIATLETMKVDLAIPSPISGEITATNGALARQPELLNQDPYGQGWLVEMSLRRPEQAQDLLSPADYFAMMQSKAESERRAQ